MLYTIGEAAKMLNISTSALRYYDKEGLLPFLERSDGGIRKFRQEDLNWLFVIECLKKSGLSIKDIKHYITLSIKGDETIDERLDIFLKQRERVVSQIKELEKTLDVLNYKCWYYETAQKAGTVSAVKNIPDDEIPEPLLSAKKSLYRKE